MMSVTTKSRKRIEIFVALGIAVALSVLIATFSLWGVRPYKSQAIDTASLAQHGFNNAELASVGGLHDPIPTFIVDFGDCRIKVTKSESDSWIYTSNQKNIVLTNVNYNTLKSKSATLGLGACF